MLLERPKAADSSENCHPVGNLTMILSPAVNPPVVVTRNSMYDRSPFLRVP